MADCLQEIPCFHEGQYGGRKHRAVTEGGSGSDQGVKSSEGWGQGRMGVLGRKGGLSEFTVGTSDGAVIRTPGG